VSKALAVMIKMTSRNFAIGSIIVGAVFAAGALVIYLTNTTELDSSAPIAPEIFASYGGLIGGVVGTLFSLAGVFLLIQNLKDQGQNFIKQQIENRFFELIKFHRENSSEISIGDRSGRKIYISLLREYRECQVVVEDSFNDDGLTKEEILNVSYMAFFYGAVGLVSEEILEERFSGKKYENGLTKLIDKFKARQCDPAIALKFHYVLFEGHQSRLGHYFRHLYQCVTYINNQEGKQY